jgi:glycosyltransferase involved in cell wall biosynthesis
MGVEQLGRVATIVSHEGDFAVDPRPDIWLSLAHDGALPVSEPIVAVAYEARWVDPTLAADIDQTFLSRVAPATADAVRQATRVLTLSFASARNIAQLGASADRIDVVPLGVDAAVFRPGLTGGRELVGARGEDDRPYIVSVASLARRKNLPMLRDAVARLARRGFPHRLVLVTQRSGDGTDPTAALAELRSGDGRPPVIFQDVSENDLAAIVSGAAAFCMPSSFEGFGLPSLEALACGVPVIVSDRGALPEVVADAGIIIEPTVEGVEQALARVIEDQDLACSLREKGRQRAETFTWAKVHDGWMRTLTRAVQYETASVL